MVDCYLDCWLSLLKAHSQQNSFSLVPVLLSSFMYTFLSPFQPVLWGLNESLSACPQGIVTQRKRLHCSSLILHKQSPLNIRHYSKRQAPLKIRTSQGGEFYYDISSQTQIVCQKDKQPLSGRTGTTTTEMSQNSHTCQDNPENVWKTKWVKGEKLLSEWSTKLSGSWTEQNLPCSGHGRVHVARSEGYLERRLEGGKHQGLGGRGGEISI